MRELKFRIWVPGGDNGGKYIGPVGLHAISFGGWEILPGEIPEQFTGLQDKNGVDIYEGDIVRVIPNGGAYRLPNKTVEWNERSRGWNLPKDESVSWGMGEPPTYSRFEYEVIGNIHQNLELLGGPRS